MSTREEKQKVVCVSGGAGYIASWVVKLLLQRGYTVKATMRDPNDPKKTEHLLALEGAKERLQLFKGDLLEEGSFDSVVNGCIGVFHTASPVLLSVADPQLWYVLSKILAEKAAWESAKENEIDLVTINPGIVIGPLLQPTVNLSVEVILNFVNGAQTFPNECYCFADVRDVANAHVLAFENPSACGRYCVVGEVIHCHDALKILQNLYPTLHLPDKCEDDKPFASKYEYSREKAEALGVDFTPLEISLRDTIESFREKGFISV
ncbi:phenylacetaldehyde reductase-like isoform X3 [Eucalyptus grandis]|uniref:phenylacetaldehyde reductase-like isoform X3 n=1 Tax=Eucalyptus grandis TaxID=71139 RepID=UPI00192E99CC|nr:phenylacetaldehyde reductase-like isoform X3 [Eucalyptus grandis]